jgi:hypothetical protein
MQKKKSGFAHTAALENNRKRIHIQCSKAGERM